MLTHGLPETTGVLGGGEVVMTPSPPARRLAGGHETSDSHLTSPVGLSFRHIRMTLHTCCGRHCHRRSWRDPVVNVDELGGLANAVLRPPALANICLGVQVSPLAG